MRQKMVAVGCILCWLMTAAPMILWAQTDNQATPKTEGQPGQTQPTAPENQTEQPIAFFPQPNFDFPPIVEGVEVTHDFIVQNKGTATLNVENVKTG